ncbi:hypothetical protein DL89DRAFT_69773 [Linderina pennispora]|uniref:Uncharacterized protein n=1 Tax=Linderina pennispora TaxID=61395 RepID=A0A1Y1VYJ1_9FUNG|nr:uncharacterized protein DL89DRAFT_69773 [Linderina pennispora]ORX66332.1 hypothetical protein DL89DRAFT_69773 [Linderina pennispora]
MLRPLLNCVRSNVCARERCGDINGGRVGKERNLHSCLLPGLFLLCRRIALPFKPLVEIFLLAPVCAVGGFQAQEKTLTRRARSEESSTLGKVSSRKASYRCYQYKESCGEGTFYLFFVEYTQQSRALFG